MTTTGAPAAVRPLIASDVPALRAILETTGVFSAEEVQVALELMDVYLHKSEQQDYFIFTAVDPAGEAPLGYVCVGPTPLTEATYDLYWIAVDPATHQRGIGTILQRCAEDFVTARGCRLLVAQTSSTPKYEKARNFYLAHHYSEIARIKEYYRAGDDLVIYGKYVSQSKEQSN